MTLLETKTIQFSICHVKKIILIDSILQIDRTQQIQKKKNYSLIYSYMDNMQLRLCIKKGLVNVFTVI